MKKTIGIALVVLFGLKSTIFPINFSTEALELYEPVFFTSIFKYLPIEKQQQKFQREVITATVETAIKKFKSERDKFNNEAASWIKDDENDSEPGMSTYFSGNRINGYRDLARDYGQAAAELEH